MTRNHGFTLIELLVVMAIIALLAASLLPVLQNAMDKAKQATCMGNMKHVGLAMAFYVEDHNGYIPPLGQMGNSSSGWPYYDDATAGQKILNTPNYISALAPYVSNKYTLFQCPKAYRPSWWGDAYYPNGSSGPNGIKSLNRYTANMALAYTAIGGREDPSYGVCWGGKLARVKNPSIKIFLMEFAHTHYLTPVVIRPGYSITATAKGAHSDVSNILFCDGHVEALRFALLGLNPYLTGPNDTYWDPRK